MTALEAFKKSLTFLKPSQIVEDEAELKHFGQDWSQLLTPHASLALFPVSVSEVSQILQRASIHKISIVPSGGRTGLSGGAVAMHGEVVLSLTRMNAIGEIDFKGESIRVGAGAVTEAVHHACEKHGYTWPVDFASKGSSTVGGNISTNAGGVRVIRYGSTRNWVSGLTAVTMSGEVLHLNEGLEKNNTGFDFRQLLIGSEGCLAVVCEATLKLARLPRGQQVLFFKCENFSALLALFEKVRQAPFTLSAFECLSGICMKEVLSHFKMRSVFQSGSEVSTGEAVALVEFEMSDDEANGSEFLEFVEMLLSSPGVSDGVMAENSAQKTDLWKLREGVAEAVMAAGLVHQNDVSVCVKDLEKFYSVIVDLYAKLYPEFQAFIFGHIGDGNLHVFVRKPAELSLEEFKLKCHESDAKLFEVVEQFHGSVSAEHGIGLLKKKALSFSRSPAEIELFRRVKAAFDPEGLLNPGKIF